MRISTNVVCSRTFSSLLRSRFWGCHATLHPKLYRLSDIRWTHFSLQSINSFPEFIHFNNNKKKNRKKSVLEKLHWNGSAFSNLMWAKVFIECWRAKQLLILFRFFFYLQERHQHQCKYLIAIDILVCAELSTFNDLI